MKNRLIQDNDGHWYIIPKDKIEEFYRWCDQMEGDGPYKEPKWVKQIDGPHTVTFDTYEKG